MRVVSSVYMDSYCKSRIAGMCAGIIFLKAIKSIPLPSAEKVSYLILQLHLDVNTHILK